jgi:hypothetical protein
MVNAIFAVGKSIAINHVKPVITERTILYVVLLHKRLYVDLQINILRKKEVKICQTIHRGLMIVSASIAITFLMVSRLATQIWTLVSWSVQSVAGKWA